MMMSNSSQVTFADIKLLLLDVDGVLTDGSILYGDDGSEIKVFNVKDGLGIRLLMQTDVQVAIITGRSSQALNHRCDDLGIKLLFDGIADKTSVFDHIVALAGVNPQETAFIGDDLMDLALFQKAGLAIAVSDAHPDILKAARLVTNAKGGCGAVREICDAILKAQGKWEGIIERLK